MHTGTRLDHIEGRVSASLLVALMALLAAGALVAGGGSASAADGRPDRSTVSPSTASAAAKRHRPAPLAPAPTLQPGVVSYNAPWGPGVTRRLGAHIAKIEFDIGTPAAALEPTIAAYASRGIRVMLLAGFFRRLPSTEEAQNLAGWARAFGPGGTFWANRGDGGLAVRDIEFGNETSYTYMGTMDRGGEYALRFKDAQEAIAGADGNSSMGLLAQADNGGEGDSTWVKDMFTAVPDLAGRVAGWSVHIYGPRSWWTKRIGTLIAQTAANGAPPSIPIDITEMGLATDNGRCLDYNYDLTRCMTYKQAARTLAGRVAGLRARFGPRLGYLLLYHGRDGARRGRTTDPQAYFGVLRRDNKPKGPYTTAVKRFLAGS